MSLWTAEAGGAFWLSPSSAALSNWTVRSGLHRATGMGFWADFIVDFMVFLPRNFCSHACSLTPPRSNTWATVWLCVSNESWESSTKNRGTYIWKTIPYCVHIPTIVQNSIYLHLSCLRYIDVYYVSFCFYVYPIQSWSNLIIPNII